MPREGKEVEVLGSNIQRALKGAFPVAQSIVIMDIAVEVPFPETL